MGDEGSTRYEPGPDIAVISDSSIGRARGEAAVRALAGRIAFAADVEKAVSGLRSRMGLDAALLILSGAAGEPTNRLLEIVADAARAGRYRSLVIVAFDAVDVVYARLADCDIEILCDPSDGQLLGELGLATSRRTPALCEPSGGDDGHLRRLSEEVGRIARALAELSQGEAGSRNRDSSLGEAPYAFRAESKQDVPLDADQIRQVIRMRRLRDRFFDAGLFADPAWDMLLDLMAARLERRNVAVSSLCIAAAVPPTTALRWIKTMTEAGLFERHADPGDGRRIFIALSDAAASSVEAWFAAVRREGGSFAV